MLGTAFASFLNATIYRIEQGYKYPDIFIKSSHCEKCGKSLTWWELVPILGYMFSKGSCSSCGSNVWIYNPISEFVLGLIFVFLYVFSLPYYTWIIVIFLFTLSGYDVRYRGIPRNLTHFFLIVLLLFFLIYEQNFFNVIVPMVLFVVFLILNRIKKAFGLGDLLLVLGLGIFLSIEEFLVMFFLSLVFSLMYSLRYVFKKNVDYMKVKIPMVPFFSIGFILAYTFGLKIYDSLSNLLFMW